MLQPPNKLHSPDRPRCLPQNHLLRQRVESSIDVRRLFAAIDADPAIVGAWVVYLDGNLRADCSVGSEGIFGFAVEWVN